MRMNSKGEKELYMPTIVPKNRYSLRRDKSEARATAQPYREARILQDVNIVKKNRKIQGMNKTENQFRKFKIAKVEEELSNPSSENN